MKKTNRVGEENYNTFGTKMIIVEYIRATNIIVEFQDEHKYRKRCAYKEFKLGKVKNPYDKEVLGVGYVGVGEYTPRINEKNSRAYNIWHNIMERCYEPYFLNKNPSYIDCFVCEEWHNFQNFAKWHEENYYECNNERMELDKDILNKGKIYSTENCIFVPKRINQLFVKQKRGRGKYPIGVYEKLDKRNGHMWLIASCRTLGSDRYLAQFPLNKPFQAFYTYKIFKENYIKQVADEYKDLIPSKLYEAMYNYQVEIND